MTASASGSVFGAPGDFAFFVEGVLEIAAGDGDTIRVDAGNGDPATFLLTVRADG